MAYPGSVDLISGVRPKSSGTFPLVNAADVYVRDAEQGEEVTPAPDGTVRLDAVLSYLAANGGVVECESEEEFPETGEAGKIYIDAGMNYLYRWDDTENEYVQIGGGGGGVGGVDYLVVQNGKVCIKYSV